MTYALLHTVHLLAAIGFIGTLFYEVLILAKVKPQLDPAQLGTLERALGARHRHSRAEGLPVIERGFERIEQAVPAYLDPASSTSGA